MRFFSKRLALFLSYVSWAFSLGIAFSRSWRVWEFDSDVIPMMYIGLWETSYVQRVNMSGHMLKVPMHTPINESWGVPDEIYYGQDLVLLANFLTPITLYFGSLAVWASWNNDLYPEFFQACYNISALFLFLSCFCVTLTVSWNFIVDLYGETALEFPPDFPVGKDMVKVKHVSYVLPLGLASAILALAGALMFSYEWYSNIWRCLRRCLQRCLRRCLQRPAPVLTDSEKEV